MERIHDVMSMVQYGLRTRRETATMVHEHSSRSHLVVTLTVNSQAPSFFSISKPSTPTHDGGAGKDFSFLLCGIKCIDLVYGYYIDVVCLYMSPY